MTIGISLYKSTEMIKVTTTKKATLKNADDIHLTGRNSTEMSLDDALSPSIINQHTHHVEDSQWNATKSHFKSYSSADERNISGQTNATEIGNVTQANVVIAMKIHDEAYMEQVKQASCLLDVAYNNRMLFDIVIFHTIPVNQSEILEVDRKSVV